jgi:hypothetical protein
VVVVASHSTSGAPIEGISNAVTRLHPVPVHIERPWEKKGSTTMRKARTAVAGVLDISGKSITGGTFTAGPYTDFFGNSCGGTTHFTGRWIAAYTL